MALLLVIGDITILFFNSIAPVFIGVNNIDKLIVFEFV
jgi:hypothetical protein